MHRLRCLGLLFSLSAEDAGGFRQTFSLQLLTWSHPSRKGEPDGPTGVSGFSRPSTLLRSAHQPHSTLHG
ncbi:hypothetical protein QC763_0019080 [Podospora pseudopauciseta]|uniref:Secreted protein n=1 Tax=Podospora pseudopauciseta TaxID=2093780 RepID=A0ABR0I1C8_9PEZI|nr:hypothetical protein QC763_0019080 [Podospora pseudopauciseta]